jgi:hypothetical protein
MGLVARMRRRRGERAARLAEAEAAVARAQKDRREAKARRPEVVAIVARIRTRRQENHLAEAIEQAFRGGTP